MLLVPDHGYSPSGSYPEPCVSAPRSRPAGPPRDPAATITAEPGILPGTT